MENDASARQARFAVLATALAAALFLAGTYAAPLLGGAGHPGGDLLRELYAPVCHQSPGRSFEIGAGVQAVCSRCAGLYWGGLGGLLFAGLVLVGRERRLRPFWLALAVAPTVIDALLPWVGLPQLGMPGRHVLAWPAGFVAGLFLAAGVAEVAVSARKRSSRCKVELRTDSVLEGSDG
jgi:uncharacterized membrane protein